MSIEKILDEVYQENEEENINPLTKRQVCNIVNMLLFYPIADDDQFRTALYYSVKLRSLITFSTNCITPPYRPEYNYYTNLDYPIKVVLSTMGIINDDVINTLPTYNDFITTEIKNSSMEIQQEIKNSINGISRVRVENI